MKSKDYICRAGGGKYDEKGEFAKKGNKSSLIAAIVNTVIAIIKGIAYSFTGNVAMFVKLCTP